MNCIACEIIILDKEMPDKHPTRAFLEYHMWFDGINDKNKGISESTNGCAK